MTSPGGLANLLPWNIFEVSQKMTSSLQNLTFSRAYLTRVYLAALGVNPPPPCTRQRDINIPPQAAHSEAWINDHIVGGPSHTQRHTIQLL